jgi:hypothetical protein
MSSMRLADKVRMLEKPFAIHTLHVIVTKSHPQARTILYYINASLSKLRESGEFDSIVEAHLARFWDSQGGFNASDETAKRPAPPPAKGGTLIEPPTSTASTPAKDNEGGSPKQPRTNTSIAKGDKK